MNDYYSKNLSAQRLKRCYDVAPPRIKQYLKAEIDYVKQFISPTDQILELGCGYGRVMAEIASYATRVVGIDNSKESLEYARKYLLDINNVELFEMDAQHLEIDDKSFDVVLAVQNAISAFKLEKKNLIIEAIRVTREGRIVLFSSYSEKIWDSRLDCFQLQADAGLIGEIDYEKSKNGIIVCNDGFMATTINSEEFHNLSSKLKLNTSIQEVDSSSIFCVITR